MKKEKSKKNIIYVILLYALFAYEIRYFLKIPTGSMCMCGHFYYNDRPMLICIALQIILYIIYVIINFIVCKIKKEKVTPSKFLIILILVYIAMFMYATTLIENDMDALHTIN